MADRDVLEAGIEHQKSVIADMESAGDTNYSGGYGDEIDILRDLQDQLTRV